MRRSPCTIALLPGNTSEDRSRNRSGVSGAANTSVAAPGRRALLEERRDALLGVLGRRVLAHHLLAEVVGGIDPQVDLAVEGPLADAHRQGARGGDPLRQLVRRR